jgi:hypothetical protein
MRSPLRRFRIIASFSSVVAFIGFRYNLVRYELALIGFSQALGYGGPLVVRHRIDARATRFDFARNFGKFVLILAGPGFSVRQDISERFRHHAPLYHTGDFSTTCLPFRSRIDRYNRSSRRL